MWRRQYASPEMDSFLRQHIEKIISLDDVEYDHISSHFVPKKFKKHQFMVQEGEHVPNDFFIVKGCAKSYIIDSSGKEHILQIALPEWWITDYPAYYNSGKATMNIDCVEDTEVLCLSHQNREAICAQSHKMEHFFRKKANRSHVALQQRILTLLSSNAKERYDKLLEQYPEFFQKVPKQLIASYLGVTRETLSRLNSTSK